MKPFEITWPVAAAIVIALIIGVLLTGRRSSDEGCKTRIAAGESEAPSPAVQSELIHHFKTDNGSRQQTP